jgi:hypothetical protein
MMVGHVWSVTIERVRPVDEQGEIQSEAADERIRRILGRFEKQLNEMRDGAAVVDEGSMQSLVLRLQSLLTGLSRSSGLESCDTAGTSGPDDLPHFGAVKAEGGIRPARLTGGTDLERVATGRRWHHGRGPSPL